MSAPFIGRQRELADLVALIRQPTRLRLPVATIVIGEPGSGKTRLLSEAITSSGLPPVVRVFGFEPNQTVPLAGAGDLIRRLSRVPELGPRLEGLVFGGRDAASRAPLSIFEAAHRSLAAHGPLAIAIDDLQWLDEQSLGLVHYLLRAAEPAHQPLAVAAVSRPSALAAAFASTVESLLPAERRLVRELGPMPLDDGVSLIRAIDDRFAEDAALTLWERARGSPFWLDALARSGGAVEPSRLIAERLGALRGDAGSLLAALAVGARPFLFDELAELLGWRVDRIRPAAADIIARGLAVESAGTMRVAHDLIREAAETSLPVAARRRLHARIADWIEAAAGDDVRMLREALDHRLAAGQPAQALALRVATSPGRRLLNADDLHLIASVGDSLDPGAADRTRLDLAVAELGAAIGEVELALERWARASEHLEHVPDRRRLEIDAAWTACRAGRAAAARQHLDHGRALPDPAPEDLVRLDAIEADVELWLDHETRTGSTTAARALAAAQAITLEAGGLEKLAFEQRRAYQAAIEVAIDAAMQEERDGEIPDLAALCVRVAAQLDDESHLAAQVRAGQALRTVTALTQGEALDRQAWESSKRLVLPTLTVGAGRELARVLREMGRLEEAHAVARETQELETRLTDAPKHWGSSPSIGHTIELSLRDAATALVAFHRDAAAEPDPHYRQDLHLGIAEWRARVAGPAAAAEVASELAAAKSDAALARCPRHSALLELATAELLARIGRVADARRELAEWDGRANHGPTGVDLWRLRTTAEIEEAAGNHAAAVELLETLAERLEARGMRYELLWTRLDLGRSLVSIDRARAVLAYTAAAELAEECAAASEGRIAAQALRRLGVRAWRRGASSASAGGLEGLSEREREIAGLVAAGSSNREVAEALVVSPKTVERHLTNILAKLGARNRTELASRFLADSVRGSPDD